MNPLEISVVSGVSINDLRKNLRVLNETMDRDCMSSSARYGIQLDAALITDIEPPVEVESALAAINTAHNHVSSDISLAQASADQDLLLAYLAELSALAHGLVLGFAQPKPVDVFFAYGLGVGQKDLGDALLDHRAADGVTQDVGG